MLIARNRSCLGILAGSGRLPDHVAREALARGFDIFIVGFEGFADPAVIDPWPHIFVRLGAAGAILENLKRAGCDKIVMIGPVKRPSLKDLHPDMQGMKLLTKLGRSFFSGDDALLASLAQIFEEKGFEVLGADEFLSDSLADLGIMGSVHPTENDLADIARGIKVICVVGCLDIGQSCIVKNGQVLAVEAVEGTDMMIKRVSNLYRDHDGGVLVKMNKPNQERRVDMPTIGPQSITEVALAGLHGIAIEAGATIIIDKENCIRSADSYKIFLYGFTKNKNPSSPLYK